MGGESSAGTAVDLSAHAAQCRRWKGLALTLGATLLVSPDALCVTLASTYAIYLLFVHFLLTIRTLAVYNSLLIRTRLTRSAY